MKYNAKNIGEAIAILESGAGLYKTHVATGFAAFIKGLDLPPATPIKLMERTSGNGFRSHFLIQLEGIVLQKARFTSEHHQKMATVFGGRATFFATGMNQSNVAYIARCQYD